MIALVGLSAGVFAQVDNTINPFTDPKDPGAADSIGLVGTNE